MDIPPVIKSNQFGNFNTSDKATFFLDVKSVDTVEYIFTKRKKSKSSFVKQKNL